MDKYNIDIVILWVNDNDKKWLDKKQNYQKKFNIPSQPERFRDWDNLKYLFRGIEENAPWFNHIYLVTDNQIPYFLNTDHPKVSVIDHKIIMDEKWLPTFNSRALELNLYKIPGLSENFIYLNDDIFFLSKTKSTDFFVKGKPRDKAALNVIMPIYKNQMSQVNFNNTKIINHNFNKYKTLIQGFGKWFHPKNGIDLFRTLLLWVFPYFTGFKQTHLTGNYNKSTYTKIWEHHEKELLVTSRSQFRDFDNNNQYLVRDWQLASNQFVPQNFRFGKLFQLSDLQSIQKCVKHINKKKTKIICINDTENLTDFEFAKELINEALHNLYPNKSSFEK